MAVSVFPAPAPAPAGGGGAGATQIIPFINGLALVEQPFPAGVYAFKAYSATALEVYGTVSFLEANESLISAVTLVDESQETRGSAHVGSINLQSDASIIAFQGPLVDGFFEIAFSPPVTMLKQVLVLTTSQTDFVLPFDANAFVFGGGGGGGNSSGTAFRGGGGGGSGFLTKDSVLAGTYNVVIGSGGGGTQGTGGTGGISSFGTLEASGGLGGLTAGNGGAGGSGGGGGNGTGTVNTNTGQGGIDGADGEPGFGRVGGVGSGVVIGDFSVRESKILPRSVGTVGGNGGLFYAGGEGKLGGGIVTGQSALFASASGGGGGFSTGASNPRQGGAGGSGAIYLVEA